MELSRDFHEDENNLLSKIVVIGDVNVGKTNIIRRIMGEEFREMKATINPKEKDYLQITSPEKIIPSKKWTNNTRSNKFR